MATLESADGAHRHLLRAHHRVGRAPGCDLVLGGGEVSGEHALLRWTGAAWEIRDLGSRNGTWVAGRRLAPGESAPLTAGTALAFGGSGNRWRLADDAPPEAMAVPTDGGTPVGMVGQLIALPDAEAPELTVYWAGGGRWVLEREGVVTEVQDDATIEAGGRTWRLQLAGGSSSTADALEVPPEVSRLTLEFGVSQDEEHIELVAVAGRRRLDLGSRSHHELLLTLARARLEDRAAGATVAEEGWVYQDDLLRMLATSFNKLQVHIFRARRQLGEAGVLNAVDIVERRSDSGQIRLGTADVIVRR